MVAFGQQLPILAVPGEGLESAISVTIPSNNGQATVMFRGDKLRTLILGGNLDGIQRLCH